MKRLHLNQKFLIKFSFNIFFLFFAHSAFAYEIKSYEKNIKNFFSIKTISEKTNRDILEKYLRDFVSFSKPSRYVGTSGHKKAQEYLEQKLKKFHSKGSSFSSIEFSPDIEKAGKFYSDDFQREVVAKIPKTDPNYDHWKGFTISMLKALDSLKDPKGVNFVWEKKGSKKPDEVLILGANYDTILNDPKTLIVDTKGNMPGADNNATGVVALLSLIETLDQLDLPKTIRIVFFDFEELGFSGSRSFVDKMITNVGNEKIVGYINLVMLGNDSKRDDKEKKYGNMKLYLRNPADKGSELDLKLTKIIQENGKHTNPLVEFTAEANSMNSSSHISFWEAGIPAVCMTQNWESDFNPRFHTPNDFIETLNLNTYLQTFRYITGAVLAWNYDIVK